MWYKFIFGVLFTKNSQKIYDTCELYVPSVYKAIFLCYNYRIKQKRKEITMGCEKIGALLKKLREEKGLTQKQAGEALSVSDKAVSKWERGAGLPDISMLTEISRMYGVSAEALLKGELVSVGRNGGNMKKTKFYVCAECGNIITASGGGELSCCGRRLAPMTAETPDEKHAPTVEIIDDEYYITFDHPMEKPHYIMFAALAGYDRVSFVRLYPEQAAAVRMPITGGGGTFYFYCSEHGLMSVKI